VQPGRQAGTAGTGFAPDSAVAIILDPPVQTSPAVRTPRAGSTELGSIAVGKGGSFTGAVDLPAGLTPGAHTLQAVGYTPEGKTRAVSLGIEVIPSGAPTILITGSRDGGRVRVTGATTGLAPGTTVKPRYHFQGQVKYTTGVARPTINTSGNFTWQRKTGKKIYLYFAAGKVHSNRVVIPRAPRPS